MNQLLVVFLILSAVTLLNAGSSESNLYFEGRWLTFGDAQVSDWPGSAIEFIVTGAQQVTLHLGSTPPVRYPCSKEVGVRYLLNVYLDGNLYGRVDVQQAKEGDSHVIASGLNAEGTHKIRIVKITEAYCGSGTASTCGPWSVAEITLQGQEPRFVARQATAEAKRLLFIGASQTVGFGVEGTPPCDFSAETENNDHSHSRLVATAFGAEEHVIAWSGTGVVRNFGEPSQRSQITMLDYYLGTLATSTNHQWDHSKFHPDLVSINLGTNDYSTKPWPVTEEYVGRLKSFVIEHLAKVHPEARIIVSCGPMVDPASPYCANANQAVEEARAQLGDRVRFIDLSNLLNAQTDIGCLGHPNTQGQAKVAARIISEVHSWLNWKIMGERFTQLQNEIEWE